MGMACGERAVTARGDRTAFPRGSSSDDAGEAPVSCVGRSSGFASAPGYPAPTVHRFPRPEGPVRSVEVVLAYRCGAAPESHRVPFSLDRGPGTNTERTIRGTTDQCQAEPLGAEPVRCG